MREKFWKKVAGGAGANAFGQLVSILIQLASYPIFLFYWTPSQYGEWILLAAVPAYFSLMDGGLLAVSANAVHVLVAKGNLQAAKKMFSEVCFAVLSISIFTILVLCLVFFLCVIFKFLSFNYALTMFLLILSVVLNIWHGILDVSLRAADKFPLSTILLNLARLVEWFGYIFVVAFSSDYAHVAFGGVLGRAVVLVISFFWAKKCSVFLWEIKRPDAGGFWLMLRPSFSYLLFPLSNALSLQGITLLVGYFFGASSVVVFNFYRTVSRVIVQITGIYSHALMPVFSKMKGDSEFIELIKCYKYSFRTGIVSTSWIFIILLIISPYLIKIWVGGKIEDDFVLYLIMMFSAFSASLWHVPRVFLISIGEFDGLAKFYFALSLISVIAFAILSLFGSLHLSAFTGVVVELAIVFYAQKLITSIFSKNSHINC